MEKRKKRECGKKDSPFTHPRKFPALLLLSLLRFCSQNKPLLKIPVLRMALCKMKLVTVPLMYEFSYWSISYRSYVKFHEIVFFVLLSFFNRYPNVCTV